jgi:hypothetical protein
MRLFLFAVATLVLCGMSVAVAVNQPPQPDRALPNPPQPVPERPVFIQPNPPMGIFPGGPAMIPHLEEEVEMLEAHRETKKAYVKAAEVGVRSAELNLDRILRVVTSGAASKEEADRARIDVEAAKAQVEIRVAELKEIEVKIKYARKRLEEAKTSGPRPIHPLIPPNPPKFVDPPKLEPIPKPKDPPKLVDPPKLESPPKPKDPPKLSDPSKPIAEGPRIFDPAMTMHPDRKPS